MVRSLKSLIVVIMICGCSKGVQLEYNPALTFDQDVYQRSEPPESEEIISDRLVMPPVDWKNNHSATLVDEEGIQEQIEGVVYVTETQAGKTKFSGWSVYPVLSVINTAYLVTGSSSYLERFVELFQYFLSVRMDKQGRVSFAGDIKAQWERQDNYNIFSVSPYKDYSAVDQDTLMNERGWYSLYFSDVNYSGLFVDQMLRFVQIVKENNLDQYMDVAEQMILESVKVIESHKADWVPISSDEGYYIFPKGCPFFLDGVEMPINEAAIFGSALVRLYLITNNDKWLDRAKAMWTHWKKAFALDEYGYITYPYVLGDWYEGWTEQDTVSVNSPSAPPNTQHETFHKAALTINFMILLERALPGSTFDYLVEFKKLILAAQSMGGTVISQYPSMLGFGWPLNTFHALPPYYAEGWVALMHDNEFFQEGIHRYWWVQQRNNEIRTNLNYGKLLGAGPQTIETNNATIYPDLFEDEVGDCQIFELRSSVAKMTFAHSTPKHRTLYLYVNKSLSERVRLDINVDEGTFSSIIYVPAERCILLSWLPEDEHGYPLTEEENVLQLMHAY